jgi:hypothetical protein
MELGLTILALALSIAALIFQWQLLQFLLVFLLGALVVLKYLPSRRPEAGKETGVAPQPAASAAPAAPAAAAPAPEALVEAGVVQFLARLQEKGRLVDFLMDDVTPYNNEQVGVVARVVHQGCREVLQAAFDIEPVHRGNEREEISLAGNFDAASYRLVGKVPDRPPYRGTVLHRGWRATRVSLPRLTDSSRDSTARRVIAPAEVEMG